MRVNDIMTTNIQSCEPTSSVRDAARLMCQGDCGSIPILDAQRRPVGILTDRDIACRGVAEGRDMSSLQVREIMSQPVVTVSPEASLDDCCDILEEHQLRRVLVVDEQGCCCGIVAQADIARHASKKETAEVVKEVSKSSRPHAGAYA